LSNNTLLGSRDAPGTADHLCINFVLIDFLQGNYRVERDAGDPDPHIVDLNLDLGVCDDCANETLPSKERK
jgi:exocyst complex component 4